MKRDASGGGEQQGNWVRKYGDLSGTINRGQKGRKEEEAVEVKSWRCTIVARVPFCINSHIE